MLLFEIYLQLPNLRGQAWPSMGKSISLIGQSAVMVSLTEVGRTQGLETTLRAPQEAPLCQEGHLMV